MNERSKNVIIEEKEQIPYSNTTVYGEVDPENLPEPQYKVISTRTFTVNKFDAKISLKLAKLLIAKVLPMLDTFMPALLGSGVVGLKDEGAVPNLADADSIGDFLTVLDLSKVSRALDLIDDADLDKLIDVSLRHTYEKLAAGPVQVLNPNGTYGVQGVEFDPLLVIRLTAEAILWSAGGFFDVSRWTSMLSPMAASLPLSAST